jgi:hypothetical protein
MEFVFECVAIGKAHIRLLQKRQSLEQTFRQTFHLSAWVQDATLQNMCNETIFDREEMTSHCYCTGLQLRSRQAASHLGSGSGLFHNRMRRTYTATGALEYECL